MNNRTDNFLEMRNICKQFVGIPILKDVNFSLKKGEVHALVGENGTGKSTLMKILFGIYKPDKGEIFIDGNDVKILSPNDAYKAGIRMIHQEFNLIPEFSAAKNILLGNEIMKNRIVVNYNSMHGEIQKLIDTYGFGIDAKQKIANLSVSQRQIVEILKALYYKSSIVVMDEPTAALTEHEIEILFKATRKLCDAGTSVIYISHRLEELAEVADRITIMRDGEMILTKEMIDIRKDEIVKHMVGRSIDQFFIKKHKPSNEILLSVRDLTVKGKIENIELQLRQGEVLGIAGLMGSRKTEIAKAIYGLIKIDSGEICINGEKIKLKSNKDAIKHGIGYLPEDRKTEGLVLGQEIYKNVTYPKLKNYTKGSMILEKLRIPAVQNILNKIKLKHNLKAPVNTLSGGNQQKVVMGRWLISDCKILILNEPTRGIDVGAKKEIYEMIDSFVKAGNGVILISSEMPEILNMSDRVIVVNDGRIVAICEDDLLNKQETILHGMLEVKR
jgi:ABC-type sugar transport system ATPase subunit